MEIYNSQLPLTKKEKLIFFWDYYKWWIVGGAVSLLAALSIAVGVTRTIEPDMKIIVASNQSLIDAQIEALRSDVQECAYDYNNDGHVKVDVINIVLAPEQMTMGQTGIENNEDYIDPELQMAMEAKLYAEMSLGETVIYLASQDLYDYIGTAGMNIDMVEKYGDRLPEASGELVPITALPFHQEHAGTLESLSDDLYLFARDLEYMQRNEKEETINFHNFQMEVLDKLLFGTETE